ncbi:hypothetical protein ARSEF4850_006083 [Beauveria asiatica]
MDIHGMHKYIYYARQFFSLTVLVLSVVMVFMCRYTGFFQWTSPKQPESEAADAAIHSVKAGTYALCVKTGHDFCYPIAAFLLVDIMSSLCLFLSLILFAVTVCLGQRSLESRFSKYSVLAQTVGLWAAVLSSLFAFVMYIVAKVHLQDGQLDAGFSVKGGFASIALACAALAAPLVYELFEKNPFSDRHTIDAMSLQMLGFGHHGKAYVYSPMRLQFPSVAAAAAAVNRPFSRLRKIWLSRERTALNAKLIKREDDKPFNIIDSATMAG